MSEDFVRRHQALWKELEGYAREARRWGARRFGPEELDRMDQLHRMATVHLAQVRSRTGNRALEDYLNRLVAASHSVIYAHAPSRPLRGTLHFLTTGFAVAVARTGRYQAMSLLLLVVGALGGWFVAHANPEAAYMLLGPQETRLPGTSAEQLVEHLRHGREDSSGMKAIFASFLFAHNTKVGFMACAAGALAGVPTVYLMVLNGAMLGVFSAVHVQKGVGPEMWAWILPHGITELLAVVLCGGAGLLIGAAVLHPGHRPRLATLADAGRQAVLILLGVVPMFFLAGLIEGFVRQSELNTQDRLLFAAVSAVFWILYLGRGAWLLRKPTNGPAPED